MSLKVSNAPSTAKITVRNSKASDGLGVSTYNPQQTAPASAVQGSNYNPQQTAPASALQGSSYNPQATAQAVAVAAAVAQQQAQIAAAKAKEILRVQVQGQIDTKTSANVQKIKLALAAPSWRGNLKVAKGANLPKIILPQQTEYDKAYAKAYSDALADFDKKRGVGQKRAFWQNLGDKVTFGQDRRDVAARKYAEEQAGKIQNTDFSKYESKINNYLKKQASAQDEVNKAAQNMTQAEYEKFIAGKQADLTKEYNSLVDEGAAYDGKQSAYGDSSKRKLTSFSAKALSKVGTFASDKNPVWRATLGGGWENVPSLVTLPGRGINWLGNLNTKDRTIFQEGGGKTNRSTTGKNAWQATQNQRNFNIAPWVDKKFNRAEAEKRFGKQAKQDADFWAKNPAVKGSRQWKEEQKAGSWKMGNYEDQLKRYWNGYNAEHRWNNSILDTVADPLILGGEAIKGAKELGFGDKLAEAGRGSKLTGWAFNAADKFNESKTAFKSALSENKAVKWLGEEHMSPGQKFSETQQAVRDLSRTEQDTLLKKIQTIGEKLKANPKYDLSIFDDLKAMSPKEREVLQRMSGDGKLALRDRLLMSGKNNALARAQFEDIAKKYTAFTEDMKLSDNVKTTRFGLGKKRIYSPRTVWADDLKDYNFKLFRKSRQVQNGDDFLHGVVDRFFKSNLDEDMVARGKNYQKYSQEFKAAGNQYTKSFETAKAAIGEAKTKLKRDTTGVTGWLRNGNNVREDVSLGRSAFNTTKSVVGAPTKLWKKSVLQFRPAWTVNNVLYNTQAGVLAGGAESLAEQAKMLNPRYWRKAMDEGSVFRSNLGKEIGSKGRLNKFYSGVEDWSRVAAGRAGLKKGLTEEQSLARVNKYLFDYKTSNWERPLKTAIPFWGFQKNLAKAAATMPFDRPLAAVAYNRLDRYQQTQYDQEFSKLVPQLTKLGYSEDEIQKMKEENSKYFAGRLKVGSRWITTPFNAFSEKGLTNIGVNPWLSAGREISTSTDSFNRQISGAESGFVRRIMSKFPQWELGRQVKQTLDVNSGKLKPSVKYIGKAGSEGYGLGKEKQGYDPSKPNYVKSLDPRQKLSDNALAFVGVPKSFQFDEKGFVKGKMLQKLTGEYFALDTKNMKWDDAEKARQGIFDKYGVTADEFYKGILSKYDSTNTTKIKDQKESAKVANDLLFAEYGKQPVGTRGAWAVKKLAELSKSGYYKDNPFLYSFVKTPQNPKGFLTPDSINKIKVGQAKKSDYEYAIKSGDWTKYAAKYGIKSEKAKLVQQALKTGDWTAYHKKYGYKNPSQFQANGKFFKSAESMKKYTEGNAAHSFWTKYQDAMPADRKQMLADNPQYNKRGNWTAAMWTADKKTKKAELKKRAAGFGDISTFIAKNTAATALKATKYQGTLHRRQKKVVFKLS